MRGNPERMDELREEYDLTQLAGGVRGKYYQQAARGTNEVATDPKRAAINPRRAVKTTLKTNTK